MFEENRRWRINCAVAFVFWVAVSCATGGPLSSFSSSAAVAETSRVQRRLAPSHQLRQRRLRPPSVLASLRVPVAAADGAVESSAWLSADMLPRPAVRHLWGCETDGLGRTRCGWNGYAFVSLVLLMAIAFGVVTYILCKRARKRREQLAVNRQIELQDEMEARASPFDTTGFAGAHGASGLSPPPPAMRSTSVYRTPVDGPNAPPAKMHVIPL